MKKVLEVPYNDREEAKRRGAKWNKEIKNENVPQKKWNFMKNLDRLY